MRPALDVINFGFDLFSRGPGLPDSLHIRLENIEQVVLSPRIETDKDLDPLRPHPEFCRLMSGVQALAAAAPENKAR